eukprot:433555_1
MKEYYNYLNVKLSGDIHQVGKMYHQVYHHMREHRHAHAIERYFNNNNSLNIPSVPNINIENHRSKSKLFQIQQRNNISSISNNDLPTTNIGRSSTTSNKLRPSLNHTTMPYLNTTTNGINNTSSITSLHTHRHSPVNSFRTHKKTQSFHYNHRTLSTRRTQRTYTHTSKTNRSPSIRRNSFGHSKNTSFDLDSIFSHLDHDKIMHSPYSAGRTPIHHSTRSLNSGVFTIDTLLLQTEHRTLTT